MGTSVKKRRNLRVVLVDDDPSFTLMWARVFEADGHSVVRCHDLPSACMAIAEGCDCLITDLHMRDVSGLDLIRAANHPAGPVMLLMTASEDSSIEHLAREAGASAVFRKGAEPRRVVATVEALCGATWQPVSRYATGEFPANTLSA